MLSLSTREIHAEQLLSRVSIDPVVTALISQGNTVDAIKHISKGYSCSENEAEQVVHQLLRKTMESRRSILTKRQAKDIFIPPTTDNPAGKRVTVEGLAGEHPALIDASPADSQEDKEEDVTKPLNNDNSSRQQKIIDGIKAMKVLVSQVAQAMYGMELNDEACGMVITKMIGAISHGTSDQTTETVLGLASPLIGKH